MSCLKGPTNLLEEKTFFMYEKHFCDFCLCPQSRVHKTVDYGEQSFGNSVEQSWCSFLLLALRKRKCISFHALLRNLLYRFFIRCASSSSFLSDRFKCLMLFKNLHFSSILNASLFSFFSVSSSNHCLAAPDLGASVEQPIDCPIVQNR